MEPKFTRQGEFAMERIVKVVDYVQLRLSALFLIVFVLTVSIQVLVRYFGFYIHWTEEVANYNCIYFNYIFRFSYALLWYKSNYRIWKLDINYTAFYRKKVCMDVSSNCWCNNIFILC